MEPDKKGTLLVLVATLVALLIWAIVAEPGRREERRQKQITELVREMEAILADDPEAWLTQEIARVERERKAAQEERQKWADAATAVRELRGDHEKTRAQLRSRANRASKEATRLFLELRRLKKTTPDFEQHRRFFERTEKLEKLDPESVSNWRFRWDEYQRLRREERARD